MKKIKFGNILCVSVLCLIHVAVATADSRTINIERLFNFAEEGYPGLAFPPAITETFEGWRYRYYKDTDTYLGVNEDDGIYVLGDALGGLKFIDSLNNIVPLLPLSTPAFVDLDRSFPIPFLQFPVNTIQQPGGSVDFDQEDPGLNITGIAQGFFDAEFVNSIDEELDGYLIIGTPSNSEDYLYIARQTDGVQNPATDYQSSLWFLDQPKILPAAPDRTDPFSRITEGSALSVWFLDHTHQELERRNPNEQFRLEATNAFVLLVNKIVVFAIPKGELLSFGGTIGYFLLANFGRTTPEGQSPSSLDPAAFVLSEVVLPGARLDPVDICVGKVDSCDARFQASVDGIASSSVEDFTGIFSFEDFGNIDTIVKVLDGCETFNNHFWVFTASTTDIEYELTITDTLTSTSTTYTNPLSNPSPAVLDLNAFATCP